MVKKANSTTTH